MAKRRKSKTTKIVKSAKRNLRRTGAGSQARRKESSPRDWHGVNGSVGQRADGSITTLRLVSLRPAGRCVPFQFGRGGRCVVERGALLTQRMVAPRLVTTMQI
jgi:hypothetical protein